MTPSQFESTVAEALRRLGWNAKLTPATGDFGADIIARCADEILVVQCKMYGSGNYVGFSAIKEVVYAKQHFGASVGAVIFSGRLSRQARVAADKNSLVMCALSDLTVGCLLDRSEKGRLYREQIEKEREAKNRRIARAREIEAAQNVLNTLSEWQAYRNAKPNWERERKIYFIEVFLIFISSGCALTAIWIYKENLLLLISGGISLWWLLSVVGPKIPPFLNEPRTVEPSANQVKLALSSLQHDKAIVTCPSCGSRSRVPKGRKVQITCPHCNGKFISNLENQNHQ